MTQENTTKKELINKSIPDIRPGDTIKVHQIIPGSGSSKKEQEKEKIQVFEGLVLAKRRDKEIGATITVRKIIDRIGVERIFPIFSPTIKKIEIVRRAKVRRAKLFYLRFAKGRKARLKAKEFMPEISVEETPMPVENDETPIEENNIEIIQKETSPIEESINQEKSEKTAE
jgi:large subunit ribosomal protein L19